MKRIFALAMTALLCLSLAACAAGTPSSSAPAMDNTPPAPAEAPAYGEAYMDSAGGTTGAASPYADENTKLIREANLTLESLAYDEAVAALDALVAQCGGYYGSSSFWGGNGYSGRTNRSAECTVRIPAARYNEFFAAVGDVAHVIYRNESTTDVGAEYYDAELRLSTARVKYERLLALLDKAEEMKDIITLENSISQVQYEIDSLSGGLRRYDGLIDYATIHISLSEVVRITDVPAQQDTLPIRLSKAFSGGLSDFGTTLAGFAEWAAYNFIGIIIFLILATPVAIILRKKVFPKRPKTTPGGTD